MEVGWILIFIFAFCTMVFLALALFAPEWVGISSQKTKQEEDAITAAREALTDASSTSSKTQPPTEKE